MPTIGNDRAARQRLTSTWKGEDPMIDMVEKRMELAEKVFHILHDTEPSTQAYQRGHASIAPTHNARNAANAMAYACPANILKKLPAKRRLRRSTLERREDALYTFCETAFKTLEQVVDDSSALEIILLRIQIALDARLISKQKADALRRSVRRRLRVTPGQRRVN